MDEATKRRVIDVLDRTHAYFAERMVEVVPGAVMILDPELAKQLEAVTKEVCVYKGFPVRTLDPSLKQPRRDGPDLAREEPARADGGE